MKRFLLFMLSLFTVLTGFAATETWQKVTSAPTTWDGDYLIVYEADGVAFDGSLAKLDAASNTKPVTITDGKIETTDCNFYFTVKAEADGYYSLKSASGKYVGNPAYSNQLKQYDSFSNLNYNTLAIDANGDAVITSSFFDSKGNALTKQTTMRYNKASDQKRFRYYTSKQEPIQLYKKVTGTEPDPTPLMPEKVYMISYSDQKRVELTQTTSGVYTASEVIMSLMSQENASYGFYFSVTSDATTEATYRPENNVDVECGTNYSVAEYQGNGTPYWNIAAGVYDITFDLNEKQMSLTDTEWTIVSDLGEFRKLLGGKKAYVENTAVAVAQQGKNLWIKDQSLSGDTNWMLVFADLGGVTYTNGDVIPALYGGYRSAYYGLPELADPIRGFVAATKNVGAVQPQKITANSLASTPLNSYVELRGKVEGSGQNYTLTDDTGSAAIHTSSTNITVTTGEKVVVRGFVSVYMKNGTTTYQITPVESFVATPVVYPEKMYIFGYVNGNEWNPKTGIEMTKVDDGIFRIDHANIESYGTFIFSLNTGSWDDINTNKYGAVNENDCEISEFPATKTLAKQEDPQNAISFQVAPGKYNIVVNLINNTMYIEQMTYPDNMYIIGNIPGVEWDPSSDKAPLVKNTEGKYVIEEVTISNADEGYGWFCFFDQLGSWDDNHRYGPQIDDTEVNVGEATAMVNSGNSWKIKAGTYKMVVDLDSKTFVATEVTPTVVIPENFYVIGDISRHHWEPDYTGAKMRMENDGKYHIYGVKLETQYNNPVAYFALSTMPSTDWNVVNANQYGAAASNTAIESEVETEVMKGTFNWTAAPGTYDITFDFENLKLTVKANSETNTIYYKPAEGETKVYMFAYKTSTPYTRAATGPVNALWPGEPISVEENIDNTGYIRCEVSNTFDKIEFNDGTSRGVAIDNVPNRNYSRTVYLIGDATGTGWTPDACIEMKEEKGFLRSPVYVIDRLTIEAKADGEKNYFHLTATQGETAKDWDNVNAGAFGAPEADTQAVVDGTTENRVLIGSNHGWIIPAGEFEVKFKPAENVLILKDLNPAGINNVDAEAENAEFYNIQGIRMNKSQKGLNIIRRNGKTYKTAVR